MFSKEGDSDIIYMPKLKALDHPCPVCKGFKQYTFPDHKLKPCRKCKGTGEVIP